MIVKNLLKLAMLGSSWVMYVLLGLSVLSIAAMVERWWFFRSRDEDVEELGDRVCDLLERGDHEGAIGTIDYLYSHQQVFSSGILARSARLRLENGSLLTVPLSLIERVS